MQYQKQTRKQLELNPQPKTAQEVVVQPFPFKYTPLTSKLERAAYRIAHRVLGTAFTTEQGTPGGRRREHVDLIAGIVQEEMRKGRRRART